MISTCDLAGPGDMPNTGPLIGELQNNGGPTETHALLLGSPAIDARQNGRTATDQRGVVRPQGAASDIGAFEFEPMVADLRLTKTADDASPDVGQIIQFVVTVTNNGPDAASNVEVTDVIDGLFFDVPAAIVGVTQGSYGTLTGIWDVGTLALDGIATLTIDVEVLIAAASQSTVNQAEVTAFDAYDPDSTPNDGAGDDFDSVPIDVNLATDLAVSIFESADPVTAGDPVTYNVTVINNGPVDATGVSLTGSTSVVATLTSLASQTSCSIIGDTFSCDLDVLEVGSELVFAVEVTSEDPGSITASANVSANELDHVPSNNGASESTTVNPASCTIVLSPSYAGGTLTVDVLVGTDVPVTGNLWLTSQSDFISLFSGPLAVTDPPISAVITRAMPPSGKVNLIATLTTPEAGTICSDFKTTGTPLSIKPR